MRTSTRANKIFQCARRVIFPAGVSHLAEIENAPVGRFPVILWIIKIFLWNIFPQGCGWLCQPSQKIYAVFKQQKTVKALTENGFIANFQSSYLNLILLFQIKQKAVYTDCFSVCASSYLPGRHQSPCGNRKCPGGTFSRKAVTGLSGQGPNGERIYRKFPVFLSKSYITFSDKTKSSLYRLLFSVRVELSSRAVASQVLSP